MSLKDYYQLLEIVPTASADEVKGAFRLQIARYHPDKVQHLGQEFQALAANRAAELTEAYRILSEEGRRGEYDRMRAAAASSGPQFERERTSRDQFIHKVTISRLRSAIEAVDRAYDELHVAGFDIAWAPKARAEGDIDSGGRAQLGRPHARSTHLE